MALLGLHCRNGVDVTQTSYELRLMSRLKSYPIAPASSVSRLWQKSISSAIDSVRAMKSASRLFDFPLPPFPYRLGVLRVVAVGIEPEATPEGRLPREVLFGHV